MISIKAVLLLGALAIGLFAPKTTEAAELPMGKDDPELAHVMDYYLHHDIAAQTTALLADERAMVTITTLGTQDAQRQLTRAVEEALAGGTEPIVIRETLYQPAPYIGFPKVEDALTSANNVFRRHHVQLPLPSQGTVTDENRLEKGLDMQIGLYGERITKMRESTPDDAKHINDDLAAFCFGDTYTRNLLDIRQRELITFAAIATLGGAEQQLKGHINGNKSAGNSRAKVIAALTTISPYIGFPRTLNALRCINETYPAENTADAQKKS